MALKIITLLASSVELLAHTWMFSQLTHKLEKILNYFTVADIIC